MASAFPQLTGIAFANLLVLAGLACFAVAIFGWSSETIAASSGFRTVSALTGALLLFYVYGTYAPRAARTHGAQAPRGEPTAQTQPLRQAGPQAMQPQPKQRQQSVQSPAQAASPQSSAANNPQTATQPVQQATAQLPEPSVPQMSTEDLLSGKWKNSDPKSASILFLKVEEQGGAVTVRAWGMCFNPSKPKTGLPGTSQYCDWGTGHGAVRDGAANVTWEQGAVLRRMRLLPAAGSLRVVVDSTYRDRRPPQHVEAQFAKSL